MRALLQHHPRTILLSACAITVLIALALDTWATGAPRASVVYVALALGGAMVVDNLVNVIGFEDRQRRRHLELENSCIDATSRLEVLTMWLEARDIPVDLDRITVEVLMRQLRADDWHG